MNPSQSTKSTKLGIMFDTLLSEVNAPLYTKLIDWRNQLIKDHGKLNEDLVIGGELIADSRIVNRALLPTGTVFMFKGEVGVIDELVDGSSINLPKELVSVTDIQLVEAKEVKVTSIDADGFWFGGGYVITSYIEGAFQALRKNKAVTIYNDNGIWRHLL
jgi:hypothetical protein